MILGIRINIVKEYNKYKGEYSWEKFNKILEQIIMIVK